MCFDEKKRFLFFGMMGHARPRTMSRHTDVTKRDIKISNSQLLT